MKKCKVNIFVIILFLVFLISFVGAIEYVPSTYEQLTTGMDLQIPQDNVLQTNQDYDFYIRPFDIATGTFADGKTSCDFWLYNQSGTLIYNQTILYVIGADGYNFHLLVGGGNFSTSGEYYYNVNCQNDAIGGFASSIIYVTPIGEALTIDKAILYSLIWIVSFLMFLGLLIYGIAADGNNKRDEMSGYILDVSNTKYLKIFALALCYVILTFLTYFTWMLCFSYLDMAFMSSIFQFIFYALAIAIVPLFILLTVLLILNKVKDAKIGEQLSRGLRVK